MVEIGRMRRAISRSGERFLERVFTPRERQLCRDHPRRLAGRFAAKEALLKAAGTGLRGFSWRMMEIVADELGAPRFICHGRLAETLAERGLVRIHLSISHARDYAMAQVLLEGGGD